MMLFETYFKTTVIIFFWWFTFISGIALAATGNLGIGLGLVLSNVLTTGCLIGLYITCIKFKKCCPVVGECRPECRGEAPTTHQTSQDSVSVKL